MGRSSVFQRGLVGLNIGSSPLTPVQIVTGFLTGEGSQGRIMVWADPAPAPFLTAKSAYFGAISTNFDTRPPLSANPGSGPGLLSSIWFMPLNETIAAWLLLDFLKSRFRVYSRV